MTISDLVVSINAHLKKGKLKGFMKQFESLNFDSVHEHVEFSHEHYKKILLHQVDEFEIVLICWLPHQKTPLHKHPKNGCLMKLFKGSLQDVRLVDDRSIESIVKENDITYIEGGEIHTISNLEEKSISLHVYAPGGFYD